MSEPSQDHTATTQSYLVGFALALLLTALPFALVLYAPLSKTLTLSAIAAAACVQILVHLRFFLHLSFSPHNRWFLVTIAFTALILCIMIGGSLWIMQDLNQQMMP